MDNTLVFSARQRRAITNQKTSNEKKRKRNDSGEDSDDNWDVGDDLDDNNNDFAGIGDDNYNYFEQLEEECEKINNLKLKNIVRDLMPRENPKFDINIYSRGMLAELSVVHCKKLESDEVSMDPSCSTGKTVAEFNSELNRILSSKKIQSKLFR